MWQPGVAVGGGDLAGSEQQAVDNFMNEVLQKARIKLDSHGLGDARLPWERPHSRIVWYGTNLVTLVGDPLSGGMATKVYADGRQKPHLDPQDVVALVQRDVGFRTPFWISVPTSVLSLIGEARESAVNGIADRLIGDMVKQHDFSQRLGIDEALTYLNNARRRMEEGTPEAMADVKTNCRNALQSLVLRLAGTTELKKATQILVQRNIFSKHEAKFVEALSTLLDAFFDVASWPGGHPPLPTLEDATFVLRVTEASVNYIAERALAAGLTV